MKNSFLKSLFAPLFSLALVVISSSPFMTFVSLKLRVEGFNDLSIGYIQSSFYLGYLIGSVKVEHLVKRIGYIRSFATFASLYSGSMLIQGIFLNGYVWALMRFFGGFCIAGLYIVIESWLLSASDARNRGRILSIYMIILYAAQAFSQLFLQVINTSTLIPFMLFGMLCSFSIIPLTMNYSKTPDESFESHKMSIKMIYQLAPLGFWGALASGFILSAIYTFFPVFAIEKDVPVAYLMTITIAGGFILQWPLGHLSDILDRRKVLIFIAYALAIPTMLTIFFAKIDPAVYLLSFFIGGFSFTIYPLSITQVCDRIDTKYTSYVIGILSLTYGIGAIIGPILTSLFMELHVYGLFIFISIVSVILAIAGTIHRIKHPSRALPSERTEYVSTSASPLTAELDPRTPESDLTTKKENPEKLPNKV